VSTSYEILRPKCMAVLPVTIIRIIKLRRIDMYITHVGNGLSIQFCLQILKKRVILGSI
jgi:hypothetical protein